MMINTYNSFTQNSVSRRLPNQNVSSNMKNPLLHSTPDSLTYELINALDSDSSGSLGQFESGLNNSDFAQMDGNSNGEIGFNELSSRVETERESYLELLFVNAQYSAFSALSEEGFFQMTQPDSESSTLMESTYAIQEQSDFQKVSAYIKNLSYHTRLNPAQPAQVESNTEESSTENSLAEDADLHQIIAALKQRDMEAALGT
jgi:hypothetical protein